MICVGFAGVQLGSDAAETSLGRNKIMGSHFRSPRSRALGRLTLKASDEQNVPLENGVVKLFMQTAACASKIT